MANAAKLFSRGITVAGPGLLLLMAGCQQTHRAVEPARISPVIGSTTTMPTVTRFAENGDMLLNSFEDPCAGRMEDLIGPLHLYYQHNHRGPEKIEELAAFALPAVPFQATCPVSGRPYACVADGLQLWGDNLRIYIYDAESAHHGQRWCIVNDGAVSGAAGFSTVAVPEARFQKFLAAAALPANNHFR